MKIEINDHAIAATIKAVEQSIKRYERIARWGRQMNTGTTKPEDMRRALTRAIVRTNVEIEELRTDIIAMNSGASISSDKHIGTLSSILGMRLSELNALENMLVSVIMDKSV